MRADISSNSLLAIERGINAYRGRIYDYPDRIFCFEDYAAERGRLQQFVAGKNIILELGSGSGGHLIGQAARHPEALCFGCEVRFKRVVRTIEKAQDRGVENAFVLRLNAKNITDIFAMGSVSGIFVNFPDPWDKRRTWKHRMLNSAHIAQCLTVLQSGGFISFKTDHADYFSYVLKEAKETPGVLLKLETSDLYQSEYLSENIQTEFEEMFVSQKLPIHYAKFVKAAET